MYKSDAGKQEILGMYREILAAWPVQNRQYEVQTSFGPTFVIESAPRDFIERPGSYRSVPTTFILTKVTVTPGYLTLVVLQSQGRTDSDQQDSSIKSIQFVLLLSYQVIRL